MIKDHDYLKIGYASNIKDRKKAYRTHTLYTEWLDQKPGTLQDEAALHDLCKEWQVESEWFKNCQEVIDVWNNYKFDIEGACVKLETIINKQYKEIREHLDKYLPGENHIFIAITNKQEKFVEDLIKRNDELQNEQLNELISIYKSQIDFISWNQTVFHQPYYALENSHKFKLNKEIILEFDAIKLAEMYNKKAEAWLNQTLALETTEDRRSNIWRCYKNALEQNHFNHQIDYTDVSSCTDYINNSDFYTKKVANLLNLANIITKCARAKLTERFRDGIVEEYLIKFVNENEDEDEDEK